MSAVAMLLVMATPVNAQKPVPDGYPPIGSPATVTLIVPGDTPRRQLRYAPPSDLRTRIDMTLQMEMGMNMGGTALAVTMPTVTTALDLAVSGVSSNGDIGYGVTFTKIDIDDASGSNPMTATLQQAFAAIAGLTGTATMTDRGITKAVHFNLDKLSDAQTRQMLSQITNSVQTLSMPFPEEAVGVGAKWEGRQAVSTNNLQLFQKTIYEIVSLDGAGVTLSVNVEQMAQPQTVSTPTIPGVSMDLVSLTGSGAGTVAVRLNSLAPLSDLRTSTSAAMSVNTSGQSQSITTDFKIHITTAPGK
jgi:hypothetical protein